MTEKERKRLREIMAEVTAEFLKENREAIIRRVEKRVREERKNEEKLP